MASFTATPANWTNSSDANFRTWGSYLAARFLAVGLVQTADTGQINWTTVTAPVSISTYQGYEIWRFDDTLQATAPVYFKIQYGSGNVSANNPATSIVFGTGSDGTGNLTGSLSTAIVSTITAYATAGSLFGSGSTNRFVFATWNGASTGVWLGFERTLDSAGDVTSEGVWIFGKAVIGSGGLIIGFWNRSTGMVGPAPVSGNSFAGMFPDTTGVTGVQTIVAPVFPEKGVFGNPVLNVLGYLTGDIAANSTPTIYAYGAAHVYYCIATANGVQSSSWRGPSPSVATEAMAIRYE
jgi:hypothetical protein